MSAGERIKVLRKELKLSQTAFGEKIGVKRDVIANVELERAPVKDLMLKIICRTFNVNPLWLEKGEGEMFLETPDTILDDLAIEFAKRYTNEEHTAELDFWSTFHFKPKDRIVDTNSIRGSRCKCDETQALCSLIRRRIAVCPDGDINICHQMTGALKKDGRCLGNVIKDGLSKVLEDSEYQRIIEAPVSKRKEFNKECQECEYWNYCVGGCPVMGHEHHKEFTESPFPYYYDYSKCVFFKNDYYHKLASILPIDWVLL